MWIAQGFVSLTSVGWDSSFLCVSSDLVQKAKKAKDKLLKRDGEERNETSYESFYYGGVDPYMWEPQELGEFPGR